MRDKWLIKYALQLNPIFWNALNLKYVRINILKSNCGLLLHILVETELSSCIILCSVHLETYFTHAVEKKLFAWDWQLILCWRPNIWQILDNFSRILSGSCYMGIVIYVKEIWVKVRQSKFIITLPSVLC